MKVLKTILVFLSFVIQAGAEGLVEQFNLPSNTPGLNKDTIDKNSDEKLIKVEVNIGMRKKYYLSFPKNGQQPNTIDAITYSGANIKSDNITEWYMKVFGLTPIDKKNEYLKAGWREIADDKEIDIQKSKVVPEFILKYDESFNRKKNVFWKKDKKKIFQKKFAAIASNPVGRVLLYRILIEIRRHNNELEGVCESCVNSYSSDMLDELKTFLKKKRNRARNMSITWSDLFFCYMPDGAKLGFPDRAVLSFNDKRIDKQEISTQISDQEVWIDIRKSYLEDDLFHELLHWYHQLRHPIRFYEDANYEGIYEINERLGGYYYPQFTKASDEDKKLAATAWMQSGSDYIVSIEEMRTILGDPSSSIEGDDISENTFALSRQKKSKVKPKIRFGHKNFDFVENIETIKLAINSVAKSLIPFNVEVEEVEKNFIDFFGDNSEYISGFGKTKYPLYIEKIKMIKEEAEAKHIKNQLEKDGKGNQLTMQLNPVMESKQ